MYSDNALPCAAIRFASLVELVKRRNQLHQEEIIE